MMELTFIDKDNEPEIISVSEGCYERLANIGFDEKVKYENETFLIEGDEYSFLAAKLSDNNRKILLQLIELERHKELESLFSSIDSEPTIKEVRQSFSFIKELTLIYSNLQLENHIYFSYE
ncbi:hypothetical protein ACT21L_004502 [Vibrio vulnificus]|nr:hypothetical protein [Vibrio vulnificus]ELI3524596.1 hypothetical protein [Vibrio vulnificus]HDY7713278.1 hypothetical protein [Vibrio vulnificus]